MRRNTGQRVANARPLKNCNQTGKHQESSQVIAKDNTKDEKARGNAGFKFVCAAAKKPAERQPRVRIPRGKKKGTERVRCLWRTMRVREEHDRATE